jgi:hypothetical protein
MKNTTRTSLLINCSEKEATEVRTRARTERRTVSAYIVNILHESMKASDGLVRYLRNAPSFQLDHARKSKVLGPRTTLHVYCTVEEANQIRKAGHVRQVAMSHYVLSCLHRRWEVEDSANRRRAERTKNAGFVGRATESLRYLADKRVDRTT